MKRKNETKVSNEVSEGCGRKGKGGKARGLESTENQASGWTREKASLDRESSVKRERNNRAS